MGEVFQEVLVFTRQTLNVIIGSHSHPCMLVRDIYYHKTKPFVTNLIKLFEI